MICTKEKSRLTDFLVLFPYKLYNYTPLFLFLYDNYYDNIINKDLARVICPSSAILRHEHSYIKEISINKVKDFFGPSKNEFAIWNKMNNLFILFGLFVSTGFDFWHEFVNVFYSVFYKLSFIIPNSRARTLQSLF